MARTVALDEATLAGFRNGDEVAVRSVYRHYSGLAMAVALRVVGDRGRAEEAVQQAFLQAWRSASSFETGRDLAPWLATITRRVAIDIQRREARRPASALDDADPGDPALIALPPSEEQVWDAAQVRLAIDALPDDEREIVPGSPCAGRCTGAPARGGTMNRTGAIGVVEVPAVREVEPWRTTN